jgi:hypothetical protein
VDSNLDYRVYAEEPEDMAGASWMLKASNEAELTELIETLNSPEFGLKSKEEEQEEQDDVEIDEEQLLDHPKVDEKNKFSNNRRPSSTGSSASKSAMGKIQMTEEERAKVQMENKQTVFWDRHRKQEILNKVCGKNLKCFNCIYFSSNWNLTSAKRNDYLAQ